MAEKLPKPDAIRIVAAVILGIFVGFILFFVFALFIGAFNQAMGMNIPVSTQVAENILSAVLLIVIIIICIMHISAGRYGLLRRPLPNLNLRYLKPLKMKRLTNFNSNYSF